MKEKSTGSPDQRAAASPTPPARSGFEPMRRFYRRYTVLGGLLIAVAIPYGALVGGPGAWLAPSILVGIGACFAAFGVWGSRVGGAAQTLSSSLNLLQAGKLAEASAALDTLEASTSPGVVESRNVQRAMIALRRGDLEAAERHAGAVIAAPRRLLFRTTQEVQRGAALGLRAFARAARGDLEGAEADAAAVRAARTEVPEALAYAALAEAMALERRGDRAGLGALLRRDRKLLRGGLDVRERAVVRALQRMLKAAPRSVYRTAAEPKRAEAEGEPTIAEWIDRVAPELSAFAPPQRPAAGAPAGAPAAPPEMVPSAEALAQVKAQMPSGGGLRLVGKLVGLWAVLSVMLVAIWTLLEPTDAARPRAHRPPPPPPPASPLDALVGVALAALLIGLFAWMVRRNQAMTRRLHRLLAAILRGDDVDAELAELARSRQELTAAQAELLRAAVADRRGQLAEAVARVDAGRARLRTPGVRAGAAGMLAPSLTAARAAALAAMGRADEAAAELSQIPPDYVLLDRTRFTVQLVALVARGDVDAAGDLVAATPPELSIGPRDELVRDLVRAVTAPSGAGAGEIARLRDELREDEEQRRWIEQVAPALLARFDRIAAPGAGGAGEEDAGSNAAEQEAAAEEEAAAPGRRARRAAP
ncbi:MAG: hypothetical protein IT372_27035 [Polyangiaceae bacterium]|nr:hypothetical protein [Polyangiaceae bacterium]